MASSVKRRKKRRRRRGASPAARPVRGGIMTGMVGGFRRAVGVKAASPGRSSWLGTLITVALAAAAIALIVRRCA
jgi:hypothetical protein